MTGAGATTTRGGGGAGEAMLTPKPTAPPTPPMLTFQATGPPSDGIAAAVAHRPIEINNFRFIG